MMTGLVQNSAHGSNLCKFGLTVTYQGTKQDLESGIKNIELANDVQITKPADRIELKSQCSNSAACVFTVKKSDVVTWSGFQFQGATAVVLNFTF